MSYSLGIARIQRKLIPVFSAARAALPLALISSFLNAQQVDEVQNAIPSMTFVQSNQSIASPLPHALQPLAPSHLQWQPGHPIDIRSLPADVLNCDECRRRLGLQPLVKAIKEKEVVANNTTASKPADASISTEKPSLVNSTPPSKSSSDAEVEPASSATTKPLITNKPATVAKPTSNPETLRVEGVLLSPATQRIEIEILKKQLLERDLHLKQFGEMHSKVEERIDELVRLNEDLAKKDASRRIEIDRMQQSSQQILQKSDLALSDLKAELSSARAEAREQTVRLSNELAEAESSKTKEVTKLSNELMEAKQSRLEALANLRKELASTQKNALTETSGSIAEQLKTIEAQRLSIREMESKLAKAEVAQREDADRIEKFRKELTEANSSRTKILSETALRSEGDKNESPANPVMPQGKANSTKSKQKAKTIREAVANSTVEKIPDASPKSESPNAAPSAPVPTEPPKNRRAF